MKRLKIIAIAAAILCAVVVAFGIYTARQARYYQIVLGSGLDRELGFRHGSPYFNFGDDSSEVFTLQPQPDGLMWAAGVRESDIVLDHSITDFYRVLHQHRGSTITFRVTDGGDGVPLTQRTNRTIILRVPDSPPTK